MIYNEVPMEIKGLINHVKWLGNSCELHFTYIKYKCHVKVLSLPEFKGCAGKDRG